MATPLRTFHPRRGLAGFSLVEVLVAVAVLALILVVVTEIVRNGNLVIGSSRSRLSADAQAREVFNRFGTDIARMVKRADADFYLSTPNLAGAMLVFYSESPGFSSMTASERNSLSLIGYRVGPDAQLLRLGKALGWEGTTNAPVFLSYSNSPATNSVPLSGTEIDDVWNDAVSGGDGDYHLLADSVFRIALCFQMKDGSRVFSLPADSRKGKLADVRSLILTLAILDGDARKIVPSVSSLASALPDPTQADLDAGVLPGELWKSKVNDVAAFASAAGIPKAAASRVRIYQRSFLVNVP